MGQDGHWFSPMSPWSIHGGVKQEVAMRNPGAAIVRALMMALMVFTAADAQPSAIRIGINAPLTGEIETVGRSTQQAAQLYLIACRA